MPSDPGGAGSLAKEGLLRVSACVRVCRVEAVSYASAGIAGFDSQPTQVSLSEVTDR